MTADEPVEARNWRCSHDPGCIYDRPHWHVSDRPGEQHIEFDDNAPPSPSVPVESREQPREWPDPPYSDCGAWVRKAWSEWHGDDERIRPYHPGHAAQHARDRAPYKILMLLPANRVEQGWWQDLVEPHRDRPGSPLRVEFLRGRMRFDRPNAVIGPKGDRPPFGCALLIWSTAND